VFADLIFWLLLRFWRPFLAAFAAIAAGAFLLHVSDRWGWVIFVGTFAVTQALVLVSRRRQRRHGPSGLQESVWTLRTRLRNHLEAGVETPEIASYRKNAWALVVVSLLAVPLACIFGALLLAPRSLGQRPVDTGGRLAYAGVAAFMLGTSIVLLTIGVGLFASSRFSNAYERDDRRRQMSLTVDVAALAATALIFGIIYSLAPHPSAADRADARRHAEALRQRRAAAERKAELTRNVHRLGTSAADGELVFSLRSLRDVRGVPQSDAAAIGPVAGDTLTQAVIRVTNTSNRTLYPFIFAGEGAQLVNNRGGRFRTIPATYGLPHVGDYSVRAGATAAFTLVFQHPEAVPTNGIVVWDIYDLRDRHGASYVYFLAGHGPAIRRLGATADASSSDR
jgi:hypothetical protein